MRECVCKMAVLRSIVVEARAMGVYWQQSSAPGQWPQRMLVLWVTGWPSCSLGSRTTTSEVAQQKLQAGGGEGMKYNV